MDQIQKEIIKIGDPDVIKVYQKPFTKKILDCFNNSPKSASEISSSISFPKEKIYYHIKNLLAKKILFITNTSIEKGIEQKKYLPTAKLFLIEDGKNKSIKKTKIGKKIKPTLIKQEEKVGDRNSDLNSNPIPSERKVKDRRRNLDTRTGSKRRSILLRRNKKRLKFKGKELRIKKDRRIETLNRRDLTRRKYFERRFITDPPIIKFNVDELTQKPYYGSFYNYKNYLLQLNGVQQAMTFVQSENRVTFLQANLLNNGFQINKVSNYSLPIVIKKHEIHSLPELIINIFQQFISDDIKKKIFLAVHSDKYNCEMTYVYQKEKSKRQLQKALTKILQESYSISPENSYYDYLFNDQLKNTAVCFSSKKEKIKSDHNELLKAGLTPRYNTSIPRILHNLYMYYNLNQSNTISLLIYIDNVRTHTVLVKNNSMLDSRDFPKGLNYFSNRLVEVLIKKVPNEEAYDTALHYLENHGVGSKGTRTISKTKLGLDVKKAGSILDHLTSQMTKEIQESIYYFQKSIKLEDDSGSLIKNTYITGPGSHIKYLDEKISEIVGAPVKNFDTYNDTSLKIFDKKKRSVFERIKADRFLTKQKISFKNLNQIKHKIKANEKAIETSKSPESAKYRLTRLEIEKTALLKSIDKGSKTLIDNAKEFKSLKKDYVDNQESYSEDLHSVTIELEEQSEGLLKNYKEHEYLINKISELEYASDQHQKKKDTVKLSTRGRYESQIKSAAKTRTDYIDRKEVYEQEIDEQEIKILNHQDIVQNINIKLENGRDEIEVFEYLKHSIQNVANAFKRSFLRHLNLINAINNDDLSTLQQAEYLLTQNNKRLKEISKNFEKIISGESDFNNSEHLDGENGFETREKLLKVLVMVLEAPNDLYKLKSLTSTIVKLNTEHEELNVKNGRLKKQIKIAKIKKVNEVKGLQRVKKQISIHEKDLKIKEEKHNELKGVLHYTRETKEMVIKIVKNNDLIKKLKPEQKNANHEMKDIKGILSQLDASISICETKKIDLVQNQELLISSKELKIEKLNDQAEELTIAQEGLISELDDQSEALKKVEQKISNSESFSNQLNQQQDESEKELEDLIQKRIPFDSEKLKKIGALEKVFQINVNELDEERMRKVRSSEKTKNTTIKAFFKKEIVLLHKKQKSIQKLILKSTREIQKTIQYRDKTRISLVEKKKKKLPLITEWKKQIKGWERDLKRARSVQDRLDELENKRIEWESLLKVESLDREERVNALKESIERKQSSSYLLFLQRGLSRFNNQGDPIKTAKGMAKDSIDIDQEEITELNFSYDRFKIRYNTFLVGYRKDHKNIMEKLNPLGGRKKTITGKINSARKKIVTAEKLIQTLIDNLDKINKELSKKENAFLALNEKAEYRLNDIQLQLDKMPDKEAKARADIDSRLESKISLIVEKESLFKTEYLEKTNDIEKIFFKESVVISIRELSSRMDVNAKELTATMNLLDDLRNNQSKIQKTISFLKGSAKNALAKVGNISEKIEKEETKFQEELKIVLDRKEINDADRLSKKESFIAANQKREEFSTYLNKVTKDIENALAETSDLKQKIMVPEKGGRSRKLNKRSTSKKTNRFNIQEKLRSLEQMDTDLSYNLNQSELSIKELENLVEMIRAEESDFASSINLLENDIEFYSTDQEKIKKLIFSNTENIQQLALTHQNTLKKISNVKGLYPATRTMINGRIQTLYSLIEAETIEKENMQKLLYSMDEELKEKRIEVAMLDQELAKINKDMQKALEDSRYDSISDESEEEWKWNIPKYKMDSYMDLAQMKTRSKELSSEIIRLEQDIANFQKQQASLNHLINESEKISQRKFKRMEESCTRLELQISKENHEVQNIEKKLEDLKGLAFNYGDRIETLEKELSDYREKEKEHELLLQNLDRSLDSIKLSSEKIVLKKESTKKNTIVLDYMANLGLLMDHQTQMNLMPYDHKKEYRYFSANRLLQGACLALVMVFSLAGYTQRSRIEPLESVLPIKKSELSLLNMRQAMKSVVKGQNTVANTLSSLIDQDKKLSAEMVLLLKYLTKKVPSEFNITTLSIDTEAVSNSKELNKKDIAIILEGFLNEETKRASLLVEGFHSGLKDSGHFKEVSIRNKKQITRMRTSFSISMVY